MHSTPLQPYIPSLNNHNVRMILRFMITRRTLMSDPTQTYNPAEDFPDLRRNGVVPIVRGMDNNGSGHACSDHVGWLLGVIVVVGRFS
mmetsp:Transcript_20956/g.50481  ORF Transcript_20956/g.50481 Transcript_20956/m.50481 type:complete len:88 (-) Transcript_20956:617-880(-)